MADTTEEKKRKKKFNFSLHTKRNITLGVFFSFIFASSTVFWPFFELHFTQAATYCDTRDYRKQKKLNKSRK